MTLLLIVCRAAATGLAWFGAFVLFVLSPAIGSVASIVAVTVAILISPGAMPAGFWNHGRRAVLLVGFAALGIGLVVEALLVLLAHGRTGMTAVEITLAVLLLGSVAILPANWATLRRQPAMLLFLAAFISLTVAFVATAQQPGDVVFATNFLGLLLAPAVYLMARRQAGSRTITIIVILCALGAVVGMLVGCYDVFIQHKQRAIGWGAGGNLMARAVVPLGFMALGGVLVLPSRWRWLLVLAAIACLYALYLTQTRGVFIAIPVLGLLFLWALMREANAKRGWYVAGVVVLIFAVAAIAIVSPRFVGVVPLIEQALSSPATVADPAATQRIAMWQAGWQAFLRSPLTGFGWAHLADAAKPFVLTMYHNDFFNAAVAAGVVGIVAWLATLVAPLAGILAIPHDRYANLRLYCALLLSLSFLIFGLTDMTFGYDLPTTLHAFLTAIVLGAFREPEPSPINRAD